jgi:hypothetical protein
MFFPIGQIGGMSGDVLPDQSLDVALFIVQSGQPLEDVRISRLCEFEFDLYAVPLVAFLLLFIFRLAVSHYSTSSIVVHMVRIAQQVAVIMLAAVDRIQNSACERSAVIAIHAGSAVFSAHRALLNGYCIDESFHVLVLLR